MATDPEIKTRPAAIGLLARAAWRGRLGLFVGTGFSIATTRAKAPNFQRLLQEVATAMKVDADFTQPQYQLKSLPQIATQVARDFARKEGISEVDASHAMRKHIARICNLPPSKSQHPRFAKGLKEAQPSWIITTNYDLILETLIENSESVLPTGTLFPNQEHVPIYHLHGHRHFPPSIKVTEEDYVGLLAPLDYQRLKLPLLFAESTTLLLGYSLGDINVRAAIEWSKSFRPQDASALAKKYETVVLALYKSIPAKDPYLGSQGELVVEIDDIAGLLEEIGQDLAETKNLAEYVKKEIADFLTEPNNAQAIANPGKERDEFIGIVKSASNGFTSANDIVDFLGRAIDPIWEKARADGGFAYYDEYLSVLVAVMEKVSVTETSPTVIYYLANALDKTGPYFDERFSTGSGHDMTRTWLAKAPGLDGRLLHELRDFAETNDLPGLEKILKCSTLKMVMTK